MYVFKAFCTRKERKLRDGQTIQFRFYLCKLKSCNNRFESCYKPEKSIGLFFIVEIIDFDL